jgi:uncharacterized alkaline shock family protein YloU
VRIEDGRAAIDLRLVVRDGVAIPAVVEAVRARVTERVEFGTGLAVSRVDVGVVDVVPAPPAPRDATQPSPDPKPKPRPRPKPAGPPAAEAPAEQS